MGTQIFRGGRLFPLILIGISLLIPLGSGEAISISVSPIRVEHYVPAGSSVTEAITIVNDGTSPVFIRVKIEDWTLTPGGGLDFHPGGTQSYSAGAWIRVNPKEFSLKPNESQDVRYALTIPMDTAPGGYRAAIIFATIPRPVAGEKQKQVMVEGRIATILYQTVGKPLPSGDITDLAFKINPAGNPEFLVSFKNTGQVHIRSRGEIIIRDRGGKEMARIPLPDSPILPQSQRDLRVALEQKLSSGDYVAELLMDIGRKELLGGERRFSITE